MIRSALFATVVLLAAGATNVLGHEGTTAATIAAEPSTVAAGGTFVLAGSGLEPNDERVLRLVGEAMSIDLGSVMTDAEGSFEIELTIPGHVPAGAYEIQAIGDETLTTPLAVTAAAGAVASSPPDVAEAAIVPRDRSALDLALLMGFAIGTVVVGAVLVLQAERFRGAARG